MNPLFRRQQRVRVRCRPSKGLQMTHDRTRVAARVLIELHILGRAEVLARIHVFQAYRCTPLPKLTARRRRSTLHLPIVTPVALAISGAVASHFLLFR